MKTFQQFLNESTGSIKGAQRQLDQVDKIGDKIYTAFYEIWDPHGLNAAQNPWLEEVYAQLAPVITEGDDVGLLFNAWVVGEVEKIKEEAERVLKVLQDAEKKMKK